ncbi:MAG: DUF3572 domain-containing protein [Alphaproteobacteria bacterium]
MRREEAESLALQGLAFLAGDERRLGALLVQAGWTLAELRAQAGEPSVLAGVLDFLLADEKLLIAFSEETSVAPERITRARALLPGHPLD